MPAFFKGRQLPEKTWVKTCKLVILPWFGLFLSSIFSLECPRVPWYISSLNTNKRKAGSVRGRGFYTDRGIRTPVINGMILHGKSGRKKMSNELRKNPRIETSNQVDYTLYDNSGNAIGKGKGETVNLSQNGILLKTPSALKGVYVLLMAIDLSGNMVEVEGRLVYSKHDEESDQYYTGIEFMGPKENQLSVIVAFVKAYQRNKHRGLEKS
jgi:hypothetical protein